MTGTRVPSQLQRAVRIVQTRELARQGLVAFGFGGASLVTNLITGVLIARLLGPTGRGEVTAIITLVTTIGIFASFGARNTISYHIAKVPANGPALLCGWLAAAAVFAVVGIGITQLALPTLFTAQTHHELVTARVYTVVIIAIVFMEVAYGVLQGNQRFIASSRLLFAQPAIIAVAFGVAALVGHLTVESVLLITAVATFATPIVTLASVARRYGLRAPQAPLMKSSLRYATRAYLSTTSAYLNFNLDLVIMPRFLHAGAIGLYAVANSVSYVVVGVAGSLLGIVMPAAARRGARGHRTVVIALYVTFGVALTLAVPLFVFADPAVHLVYGHKFDGAIPAVRVLLVGSLVVPSTTMMASGLFALNKPWRASVAYGSGAVTTIVGLSLFLKSGGVMAAAWVTSVAYLEVFVVAVVFYKRSAGVGWRDMRPRRAVGVAPGDQTPAT